MVLVLGPIRVVVGGRATPVAGRVQRAVLATLAIGVGHAVPVDQLVIAVWGDRPPATARHTVQAHVSLLRHLLGRDRIAYENDAYVLDLAADAVDSVCFERLVDAARRALPADADQSAALAREALGLWRGRPYGDLGDDEFFMLETLRLEGLRLSVVEVALEADLACGATSRATAQLEALVEEHPYRERFWYLLVRGLAREDRRVEALRAAARVRAVLAEIGLEPGPMLADLEREILTSGRPSAPPPRPPRTSPMGSPG